MPSRERREKASDTSLECGRRQGCREWPSRNKRIYFISCAGQILDTVVGEKRRKEIPVYFQEGNGEAYNGRNLQPCSSSEGSQPEDNHNFLFYSHGHWWFVSFGRSDIGTKVFSELFAFVILIILYIKGTLWKLRRFLPLILVNLAFELSSSLKPKLWICLWPVLDSKLCKTTGEKS